jgi:hypothetical protein
VYTRLKPLPDALLMQEALDRYLANNGFSTDAYTASTFTIKLLGIPLKFPNTQARKRALPLHDLHHILTGYGTDWVGEAEIGAWELRTGCNSFVLYWLNGSAVLFGIFISPIRVWRAFLAARDQRPLYRDSIPYASLLRMSVDELRRRLGIPYGGLAT